MPWPWEYYSIGRATGYIGQAVSADELKSVPDNLKNIFAVDSNFINDGYPILSGQADMRIETTLKAVCTDASGNVTNEVKNAEKLKSVKVVGTPENSGVLYAATYKNGALYGVSLLDNIQSAGEYDISLDFADADTLKLFMMDYNQSPLSKAAEYILH